MNLDVRDFNWWTVKGRIENAKKRLVALGTARIAYHGDESYERQVRDLVDQIEILERPKMTDEEVLANWKARTNELRAAMRKMKGKN